MKRAILIIVFALFFFALGWVSVCFRVQTSAAERIASAEAGHAGEIARIRQRIYGTNYFHSKGISPKDDARLERFDATTGKGSISISYVGGIGGSDIHLQILADGTVSVIDHGTSRKVDRLDQGRCRDFFRRVITSGILNYSDAVIELKRDLVRPISMTDQNDAPTIVFAIRVPELDVATEFAVDTDLELKNFPDIIEYQLASSLEKEILTFIPKDDAFWK